MTNEQRAWLSGFIDGEGYLGLTYQLKPDSKQSSATSRYHPYLIITNTNKDAIDHIYSLVGVGRIYKSSRKDDRSKDAYQIKVTKTTELFIILQQILPYLIIKREQCELLLSYLRYRMTIKPLTGRGRRGVTSFGEKDREFYQRLLTLNKRGQTKI